MESFSYSVSHDLRAPLRVIDGLSDIVLKDYYDKLDYEGKKLLEMIQSNTKRMDQLVLALLDLSRIGRQDMKMAVIDMEKTASLIVADLKAANPERNITVDIRELPRTVTSHWYVRCLQISCPMPLNSQRTGMGRPSRSGAAARMAKMFITLKTTAQGLIWSMLTNSSKFFSACTAQKNLKASV